MNIKSLILPSREGNYIVTVDFSQLEIYILALLSGDPVLINDLASGEDLHRKRASELFGIDPEKVSSEQRKLAKQLSFMLQYGSGAENMATKLGIAVNIAKRFIDNFYNRYLAVKEYQDKLLRTARQQTILHSTLNKRIYKYVAPTGTELYFEQPPTSKSSESGLSPTILKNRPVQSLATGDIVPYVLGIMRRTIKNNNLKSTFLINTVHDDIWFETTESEKPILIKVIKSVLSNIEHILESIFTGLKFPNKLRFVISETNTSLDNLKEVV